jgi:hypothetical protein
VVMSRTSVGIGVRFDLGELIAERARCPTRVRGDRAGAIPSVSAAAGCPDPARAVTSRPHALVELGGSGPLVPHNLLTHHEPSSLTTNRIFAHSQGVGAT